MCPVDRGRPVLLGRSMTRLESISGRIVNGFYENAAIAEEDFAISGHQKYLILLKMCQLDRGRRVLVGGSMTKLESVSGRMTNGFCEKSVICDEHFAISGHEKY